MNHFRERLRAHPQLRRTLVGINVALASFATLSAAWLYLSLGPEESGQPLLGVIIAFSLLLNLTVAWFTSRTAKLQDFLLRLGLCLGETLAGAVCLFLVIIVLHSLGIRW
jgi:hypothetical protein